MFECDIVYRRSVPVSCMLYKIRRNSMHPLYGALPEPYVPVRVTRSAVPVSISVERSWRPRIRWCGTGGFQEQDQCHFIGLAAHAILVSNWFPFFFFHSKGWCCGAGVFGLLGCWLLSPSLALPTFYNNNNNNNKNGIYILKKILDEDEICRHCIIERSNRKFVDKNNLRSCNLLRSCRF